MGCFKACSPEMVEGRCVPPAFSSYERCPEGLPRNLRAGRLRAMTKIFWRFVAWFAALGAENDMDFGDDR